MFRGSVCPNKQTLLGVTRVTEDPQFSLRCAPRCGSPSRWSTDPESSLEGNLVRSVLEQRAVVVMDDCYGNRGISRNQGLTK